MQSGLGTSPIKGTKRNQAASFTISPYTDRQMTEPHAAVFSGGSWTDGELRGKCVHEELCEQSVVVVSGQKHLLIVYAAKFLTIEDLPEDALVEIFHFYKLSCPRNSEGSWEWQKEWHKLVHVCRRWRTIIFASQHRLELRFFCTPKKPITDLWPALPIVVRPVSS